MNREKTKARNIEAAERRKEAIALRLAGATLAQIGERLGCTPQAVHAMIRGTIEQHNIESKELADQLRDLEIARLDAILLNLWPNKHIAKTAETILRVMEQKQRLLGLDAEFVKPKMQRMALDITKVPVEEILAEIERRTVAEEAKPQPPQNPPPPRFPERPVFEEKLALWDDPTAREDDES